MSAAELYQRDYYEWTVRNAELLRSGRADEADLANIAEEIEDLGRRERRELLHRLRLLIIVGSRFPAIAPPLAGELQPAKPARAKEDSPRRKPCGTCRESE